MKKLSIILILCIAYSSSAQISFNTGSVQLDADLNNINASASANFELFKGDLIASYHVSGPKIDHLRRSLKLSFGEIYLALEISTLSGTPIDDIVYIYQKNRNKGWGYIAKEAGIKPGSAEFHRLKNNASAKKNKGKGKNKEHGKGKGKKAR